MLITAGVAHGTLEKISPNDGRPNNLRNTFAVKPHTMKLLIWFLRETGRHCWNPEGIEYAHK
jgi:hypothetical protein